MLKFLQTNVANTIKAKKGTVPRFNGIQKMWIGADYWPLEGKWKWRNAYEDVNGTRHFLVTKRA